MHFIQFVRLYIIHLFHKLQFIKQLCITLGVLLLLFFFHSNKEKTIRHALDYTILLLSFYEIFAENICQLIDECLVAIAHTDVGYLNAYDQTKANFISVSQWNGKYLFG